MSSFLFMCWTEGQSRNIKTREKGGGWCGFCCTRKNSKYRRGFPMVLNSGSPTVTDVWLVRRSQLAHQGGRGTLQQLTWHPVSLCSQGAALSCTMNKGLPGNAGQMSLPFHKATHLYMHGTIISLKNETETDPLTSI